jgi:cystathionine beta-synthase
VETGRYHDAGSWLVEGIGEDFIPPLAHIEGVRAWRITDREAFTTARELLKTEGILAAPPAARCWRPRCAIAGRRPPPNAW